MRNLTQIFKKIYYDPTKAIRNRKKATNRTKSIITHVFRYLILLAIGYIILYPLLYMIVTSFKARSEYYTSGRVWLPIDIDPAYSYSKAIEHTDYKNSLVATLMLEVAAALIEVAACAVAAYGFARFEFKLKGVMTAGLFLTILCPEAMIMIPRMVNYSNLDFFGIIGFINKLTGSNVRINLIGSPLAFYLPSLFAMGLRSGILIYIYIQFFKGLPRELEEAAWVDGAGFVRTFISIALPSSSVVFTTVTVFSVVWHWNDTLLASMYVKSGYPLSVMLDRIVTSLASAAIVSGKVAETKSIIMAACVLFIAPVLIFYMIFQRKFIESIDRVGITG